MPRSSGYTNTVHILAGTHRSRRVKFPDVEGLRPTKGRIREKVFNWLGQFMYGQVVLDLFSGSGIFAFESASRGASRVVAVELNLLAYQEINISCKRLGFSNIEVYCQEGLGYLQTFTERFDVIFLDPPYNWQEWDRLLGLLDSRLKEMGVAYVESNRSLIFPDSLEVIKQDKVGACHLFLIRRKI
ncbi:MAG: RsmD family RNA methyltransferase [Neisseriaceae bacterium]